MKAEYLHADAEGLATALRYENGILHFEKVPLSGIADDLGTPTYVYSRLVLLDRVQAFMSAAERVAGPCIICYAVKANGNPALLRLLADSGLGADVVSGGELFLAQVAGFSPGNIVFSGVGKTRSEIEEAIGAGILALQLESPGEMELVARAAQAVGRMVNVAVRVNPDIRVSTHSHVATGEKTHKFGVETGVALSMIRAASENAWLRPIGLSAHIGSQLLELEPFRQAAELLGRLADRLSSDGIRLEYIDVGGGLGIEYEEAGAPKFDDWIQAVSEPIARRGYTIIVEPGRSIIGPAGLLLTRVLYTKVQAGRQLAVVDAGMNDLLRPALYGARHPIVQVSQSDTGDRASTPLFDIVGPVCESSDVLARQRTLPGLHAGDLLAVLAAGAYGFSMSSNYNARGRPAEALVEKDYYRQIRRREQYSELLRGTFTE